MEPGKQVKSTKVILEIAKIMDMRFQRETAYPLLLRKSIKLKNGGSMWKKCAMACLLFGIMLSWAIQLRAAKDADLVLFYTFDKQTETIIDKSERGNDGKITGDVTWGDSYIELQRRSCIRITSPSGFDFGKGGFTVEAVIELAEENEGGEARFIFEVAYPKTSWSLFLEPKDGVWFSPRSAENVEVGILSPSLSKNKFYHLVGTRDAKGYIELYVDGKLQGRNVIGATANYDVPTQVHIGQSGGNSDWCFLGKIKEIRVYRRAISGKDDEIIKRGLKFQNKDAKDGNKDNTPVKSVDSGKTFEIAAWVDHFDFAAAFDTEKPSGINKILDYAAELGTTAVYWRNCAGSTMRYQSKVESHHVNTILDKRRTFDTHRQYGWTRYGDAQPDNLRTALRMCKEKAMKSCIHWPFEEIHGFIALIGEYNMEHPQFWGRTSNGRPWWGRVSLAYEEVIKHKLSLVDELLERGTEKILIDFSRTGDWGPRFEYVEPVINSYKEKYGEAPPENSTDLRWAGHVAGYVTEYFRRLRKHLDNYQKTTGKKIELILGMAPVDILGNKPLTDFGLDWRTLVNEKLVDSIFLHNLPWDKENPMESTRKSGRAFMEEIKSIDKNCRVFWPVSQYLGGRLGEGNGLGYYMQVMGKQQYEVASELMQMAWEEGANGITLECVDYENYDKKTRDAIKRLSQTTCQFVRKGGAK